jgi:hypothetical protein
MLESVATIGVALNRVSRTIIKPSKIWLLVIFQVYGENKRKV